MMGYAPLHVAALLAIALALAGCGTMHHHIAPVPTEPGTLSCALGLSWSSNPFSTPAIQASVYATLGSRDLVGIGLNNFFIPTVLSYAHYIKLDDLSYLNLQFHTSALGPDPRWEADLGYGTRRGNVQHALKLGVGYMGDPSLRAFGRMPPARIYRVPIVLVPVAGYDFRYKGLALAVQVQPGLSRNFAREYRDGLSWQYPGYENSDTVLLFNRDQVVAIEEIGEGMGTPREDHEWLIRLADSSVVYLSRRPSGTYSCLPCAPVMRNRSIGQPPSEYQLYTVSRRWIAMGGTLEGPLMELNMGAVRQWFHETGVLRIAQEFQIPTEMLRRTLPWQHDLSIGAGYIFGGK